MKRKIVFNDLGLFLTIIKMIDSQVVAYKFVFFSIGNKNVSNRRLNVFCIWHV